MGVEADANSTESTLIDSATELSAADIEVIMQAIKANAKVRVEFEEYFRRGDIFPDADNHVSFPNADRVAPPVIVKIAAAGQSILAGAPDNG